MNVVRRISPSEMTSAAGAARASLRPAAAEPDLVALAVGLVLERLDRDLALERRGESFEPLLPVAFEVARDVGVHAQHDLAAGRLVGVGHLRPRRAKDLSGERGVGLDDAAPLARRARYGEERPEVLTHALARHLDQAELGDLEHVGARLVLGERLLERPVDLLAVLPG